MREGCLDALERLPMRERALILKRLNVSPVAGLCYVSNPKVASSTIKLSLCRTETRDPDYLPAAGLHRRAVSPLLTWPELQDPGLRAQIGHIRLFSFVRNPFDRLRSVYVNKIYHPRKDGLFRQRAGLMPGTCPDFRQFVLTVAGDERVAADPHWRPQSRNLAIGVLRYDLIGRLETFEQDWHRLRQWTTLSLDLSRAGRQTRTVRHSDLSFDAPMQRAVQRAYAEDFARFGYDPETVPG